MTVYLMISLPKIPYMHRICMVLANPTHGLVSVRGDVCFVQNVYEVAKREGGTGVAGYGRRGQ